MKGDFSRLSFDKNNHFSRVLMQQGRVQLDSDWNEQIAILMHFMRSFVTDALHDPETELSHGGARDDFSIVVDKDDKYHLTSGRYYVNGILCENFYNKPIFEREDNGNNNSGETTEEPVPKWFGLELMDLDFSENKDLIYLEVWEQHVTAVDNPSFKDPALNGLDTTTRTQVMWQVNTVDKSRIGDDEYNFDSLNPKTTAKLEIVSSDSMSNEPCPVPSQSQYRGFENQLYRIEIHQGSETDGKETTPEFKWSRENGAISYPIDEKKSSGSTIRLKSMNPDPRWQIQSGDWVEVIVKEPLKNSNQIEHLPIAGQMIQVTSVTNDSFTIGLKDAVESPLTKGSILRRWDHSIDAKSGVVEIKEDENEKYLLEDGIRIKFGGDMLTFRAGDFWLIPARVGQPITWSAEDAEPRGIDRHYAPLALIVSGSDQPDDKRRAIHPVPQLGESIGENTTTLDLLESRHEALDEQFELLKARYDNHEEQQHGGAYLVSAEKSFQATEEVETEPKKPAPKKRGRPRKSTKKTTSSDKSSKK